MTANTRRQQAGTVIAGQKVGGQFASHERRESVFTANPEESTLEWLCGDCGEHYDQSASVFQQKGHPTCDGCVDDMHLVTGVTPPFAAGTGETYTVSAATLETEWQCSDCEFTTTWTADQLPEAGAPICGDCGDDLTLNRNGAAYHHSSSIMTEWSCSDCGEAATLELSDMQEIGTPICSGCGDDMSMGQAVQLSGKPFTPPPEHQIVLTPTHVEYAQSIAGSITGARVETRDDGAYVLANHGTYASVIHVDAEGGTSEAILPERTQLDGPHLDAILSDPDVYWNTGFEL